MEYVNGIVIDGHQLVASVHQFNQVGQITPPDHSFNADRIGFYTGMQCEELGEKIAAIALGEITPKDREHMQMFASILKQWGMDFKQGKHYGAVLRADREELLDGDIDVAVVTIGSMCYQTPKFVEAIGEVLRSNASKGENGVFTHDENGKIQKGPGFVKPNLAPYVNHIGE